MANDRGAIKDIDFADAVTSYDARQFLTYARLLDADDAGTDWREAAAIILEVDVTLDPGAAYRYWRDHLSRARWMASRGYDLLRELAGLPSSSN